MSSAIHEAIRAYVAENPTATTATVAAAVGVNPNTCGTHMTALRREGIALGGRVAVGSAPVRQNGAGAAPRAQAPVDPAAMLRAKADMVRATIVNVDALKAEQAFISKTIAPLLPKKDAPEGTQPTYPVVLELLNDRYDAISAAIDGNAAKIATVAKLEAAIAALA